MNRTPRLRLDEHAARLTIATGRCSPRPQLARDLRPARKGCDRQVNQPHLQPKTSWFCMVLEVCDPAGSIARDRRGREDRGNHAEIAEGPKSSDGNNRDTRSRSAHGGRERGLRAPDVCFTLPPRPVDGRVLSFPALLIPSLYSSAAPSLRGDRNNTWGVGRRLGLLAFSLLPLWRAFLVACHPLHLLTPA